MKNLYTIRVFAFLASFFLGLVLTETAFAISRIKLNAPLFPGDRVKDFQVSPDSMRVVYLEDEDKILSLPIDGSTKPVMLDFPLVDVDRIVSSSDSIISSLNIISPDSRRVVYIARLKGIDQTIDVFELFSFPIDASSAPVKLNFPLVSGGSIIQFFFSQDSSWVVYKADQDTNGVLELYSVPIDGSEVPVKLNPPLLTGGVTDFIQITPDSNRVVYTAQQDTQGAVEIYSVPIDGSEEAVKLNAPLVSGGNVDEFSGFISPDSSRVIYRADQDTDDVFELYNAPIDGSTAPIKLNSSLVSGGEVASNYFISPDSSRVVYSAEQNILGVSELFSVPLNRSTKPIKLSLSSLNSTPSFFTFAISPDSKQVVFGARDSLSLPFEMFSVPIDGGTIPVKLDEAPANRSMFGLMVSPDSRRVVYSSNKNSNSIFTRDLFSVPIKGGTVPVRLNPLGSLRGIFDTRITPDSKRVVYQAEQEIDFVREIYSIPIDGNVIPVKLSSPLVTGGNTTQFKVTKDGDRVVYRADQDTVNVLELYASPLVFAVDINDIIYIINRFQKKHIDTQLKNTLIANLQEIENQACAGNIREAIIQLQEFKNTVEAQGQNIKKTSADIINAGADYSLILWNSINNQELNTPAFDFIVDNNKLIGVIAGLSSEDIDISQRKSLISILETAEQETIKSNIGAALQKLLTFNSEVEMLRNKEFNSATADNLITSANNLINHLNVMLLNVQACST